MSASANIRAGAAYVELSVSNSALVRGLKAAQKHLKAFGDSVRALGRRVFTLGTAMVGGILGAAKAFDAMGSAAWDMAGRTGLSVEALSTLGYAAEQTGAEIAALENGVRRMQRTIYDAGRGLSTATDALADLGLSLSSLENLSPEDQFRLIAERLEGIADPTRKAAIAMTIFGRSGTALLPMLAGGAAALGNLEQQARDLGLEMSTSDAAAADALGDSLGDLTKSLKMAAFTIGAALAPWLMETSVRIVQVVGRIRAWVSANRGFVMSALKLAGVVAGFGAGLVALGAAIAGIGWALGVLASVVSAVGAVFGAIGTVIGAIVTPVGLATAAVVALGGYMVRTSDVGARALGWLGDRFATLRDIAGTSVQGIGDALAAGDIALAARILWLSLKVVFQEGVQSLLGVWLDLKTSVLDVWIGLKAGVMKTWQTLWFALKEVAIRNGIAEPLLEGFHLIEFGWLKVTQSMGRMWLDLVDLVFSAWTRLQSGIRSAQQWIGERAIDVMGYFDQDLDTEGAKKLLREDYAREQSEIAGRQAAGADASAASRRRLEAEQRREESELLAGQNRRLAELRRQEAIGNRGRVDELREAQSEVDRKAAAERAAVDAKAAADLKASGEALAKAREAWQAAIGEAARKRTESQAGKPEERRLRAAAPHVNRAVGRIDVQGAFDTAALRALAAAGAKDAVAANTAEMVRQQKRTNQKLDALPDEGLAFA